MANDGQTDRIIYAEWGRKSMHRWRLRLGTGVSAQNWQGMGYSIHRKDFADW